MKNITFYDEDQEILNAFQSKFGALVVTNESIRYDYSKMKEKVLLPTIDEGIKKGRDSMSRQGSCYDSVMSENFFSTLKSAAQAACRKRSKARQGRPHSHCGRSLAAASGDVMLRATPRLCL